MRVWCRYVSLICVMWHDSFVRMSFLVLFMCMICYIRILEPLLTDTDVSSLFSIDFFPGHLFHLRTLKGSTNPSLNSVLGGPQNKTTQSCEGVMSHIWMSHVAHVSRSHHTWKILPDPPNISIYIYTRWRGEIGGNLLPQVASTAGQKPWPAPGSVQVLLKAQKWWQSRGNLRPYGRVVYVCVVYVRVVYVCVVYVCVVYVCVDYTESVLRDDAYVEESSLSLARFNHRRYFEHVLQMYLWIFCPRWHRG